MAFLNKLAGSLLSGQAWTRGSPLAKACVAAAALVASADPAVSLARRATVDQILDELHSQQGVNLDQAVQGFQRSLERLQIEGATARSAALASLARLASDPAAVELLLRVSQAVALADGEPSPKARSMVAEIAASLGRPAPALEAARDLAPQTATTRPGHVIVIGNEKGGTGKSTTAIHLAVGLARQGRRVACIDLDGRQGTLSRFLANRARAQERFGRPLGVPSCRRLEPSDGESAGSAAAAERQQFLEALAAAADCDVAVVDTAGYASRLSPLAYAAADVLVTPINDSFIDIDALADIDVERREVLAPSSFSRAIFQERERRKGRNEPSFDWIVSRNRIGHLDTRNTREMSRLLAVLSRRLGFRLQPGFSERVIFRGLFFRGLTLFDLADEDVAHGSRASLRHARQEVGELLEALEPALRGAAADARD